MQLLRFYSILPWQIGLLYFHTERYANETAVSSLNARSIFTFSHIPLCGILSWLWLFSSQSLSNEQGNNTLASVWLSFSSSSWHSVRNPPEGIWRRGEKARGVLPPLLSSFWISLQQSLDELGERETWKGSPSEIQLTQSDGETLKPGESLKLTCVVSGGYQWHWARLSLGKRLEWLGRGYFSGSTWRTDYGSAFRSRISITFDTSRNEYYLQLSSMTTADSGTYYCGSGTVTQRTSIFFTKREKCDSHR
uniref:Ig-like domain-containing protein n=1 Tax=Anolis carolinensis TaxID=28377 RepID=H9GVY2_ANOCA